MIEGEIYIFRFTRVEIFVGTAVIGGVFCSFFFKDVLIFLVIITADDEMAKKKTSKRFARYIFGKKFWRTFFPNY